jgi:hypothetical protein
MQFMSDINQKFRFTKANTNTVVAKLGYRYALEWSRKPELNTLVPAVQGLFGAPAQRHMVSRNYITGVHDFRAAIVGDREFRWLFSTKHWGAAQHTKYTPYWFVFKTEKDRLLASMVL